MERTRRQLLDWMARDISAADLERIDKAMPYILQEAVREVNGEVEYSIVNDDGCYDIDERSVHNDTH